MVSVLKRRPMAVMQELDDDIERVGAKAALPLDQVGGSVVISMTIPSPRK